MSKITKEAFERCKNKSLAEQLEDVRRELREELEAVKTDLSTLTRKVYMSEQRVQELCE